MTANVAEDVVRIQKLADEQWALIELLTGQVMAFFDSCNSPFEADRCAVRYYETDWLKIQDEELLSRFRFRIGSRGSKESRAAYFADESVRCLKLAVKIR